MGRLFLLLLLVSCARPHYVSDDEIGRQFESASACSLFFESEDLCLTAEWTVAPTVSRLGELLLKFHSKDTTRTTAPVLLPAIVLWMPSMGHGSATVRIEADAENPGVFRASNLSFYMHGEWEIRYQLKNRSDVIEQKIQTLHL